MEIIQRNNGRIIINEIVEKYATEKIEGVSRESWSAKLGICAKKIFEFLLENEYDEISKEEIAEKVGYSPKTGSFINSLSQLNSLGLIQRNNGNIKLHPEVIELRWKKHIKLIH